MPPDGRHSSAVEDNRLRRVGYRYRDPMAEAPTPDAHALVAGVLAADRTALGRAITLVESTRPDHQEPAQELLTALLPHAGHSHRVGITGVPGAGKSTFLDALGMHLIGAGHRLAVLAVDPSSSRSGGSILGDKTRMPRLAVDDAAYIRPSPNASVLGGVARATREAIVVVEAAGFDVVAVETVGIGQSETTVASLVDTFVLLMLASTGDSLQGLKKGVLELADVIAVNKADGDRAVEAEGAARELAAALHLVAAGPDGWTAPVLTCSALTERGIDAVWRQVELHRAHLERSGQLAVRRQSQDVAWMWATVDEGLRRRFRARPEVQAALTDVEAAVRRGELTPHAAATRLLAT